ncbi:hypothetical protein A9Q74_05900 [Colwellia sp. 39_35_sub15_T18]|nr:hypothetical protein A9Q74_05900 [Colwellia sp. 39_35_sub15_T18]
MTSLPLFLSHFHFIRPWWFLALIALFFALWLLKKHRFNHSPWNKFLPAHLSQVLVEGADAHTTKTKLSFFSSQGNLIKPFIMGLLTIIALAGPTWQKLPQPVYQTERGSVLIMDMSYSMYATDIKPNRLTRARYKAIDLLNKLNEGDIGLIAYAGDAFVISPLTQDIKNIELLLPSLTPEIMPELGANPFAALSLAHDMLHNAGHINGDIYWFTDDVDNEDMSDIYDWSAKFGHQLNILGIGSQDGAPITLPSGELLKDNHGAIVVPKLPIQKLNALATRGNGHYQTINNNDSDIERLLDNDKTLEKNSKNKQQSQQNGDQWQEQGPWLLMIALPLLLSYFRRGSAMLMVSSMSLPFIALLSFSLFSPNTFANEQQVAPQKSTLQKTWQNLWQTDDQQAQQRYNQQDYQGAAQQFENDQWQGSAHYKAGNYQQALDAFKQGEQANSADSLYNQGNALAQMQQYQQAIEYYEQALQQNPDLADAKDNLEKIKQQQKKQEQEQKQQQQDQQSKDSQPQDEQQQDKNDKQDQQQDSQDQQSQDQKDKQQQQSDDSQQQNDTDSKSDNDAQEKQQQQNKPEDVGKEQKEQQKSPEQQESPQPNEESKEQQGKEKTAAQIAAEQQAKETEQKHQQLLNKVTDDPYLLLRNKMQLEYQKRQQSGAGQGVKKKW